MPLCYRTSKVPPGAGAGGGGGGELLISSDEDDRIGTKIRTKKISWAFTKTPKKSHAEFLSLTNSQNALNYIA